MQYKNAAKNKKNHTSHFFLKNEKRIIILKLWMITFYLGEKHSK